MLELVRDGAHGLQIDKLCAGSKLDFNPLNTSKPDVALCENLVEAVGRLLKKCREINPEFCIAAEAVQDRLIPYVDVFYRNSRGNDIAPLRYVFPEWTSCQHISAPADFRGVNGAVLTGSAICLEPFMYQGPLSHPLYTRLAEYIQEVERIRGDLIDIIFLGSYFDTQHARVTVLDGTKTDNPLRARQIGGEVMIPDGGGKSSAESSSKLLFRVHGHLETNQRAMVVVNQSDEDIEYRWEFLHKKVAKATLYQPFAQQQTVLNEHSLRIKGEGLHVLVESE